MDPQKCLKKCPKCSGPAHPSLKRLNKGSPNNYCFESKKKEENLQYKKAKVRNHSYSNSQGKGIGNKFHKRNSQNAEVSNIFKEHSQTSSRDEKAIKANHSISCKSLFENNSENNSSIFKSEGKQILYDKASINLKWSNRNELNNSTSSRKKKNCTDNVCLSRERSDKTMKDNICDINSLAYKSNHQDNENENQIIEYNCDSSRCGYAFCVLCLGPAHVDGFCPQAELQLQERSPTRLTQENETYRNSKKIKKSLRRLL